jgi:hypothetical protein
MKFIVTFKCPDAVQEAIDYALEDSESSDNDELRASYEDLTRKFVMFGEMVTVEFDTNEQTAKVLPVRK